MKKALKYLVLLILCMINRNTQAQGYIPMLNDSAVWVIGNRTNMPQGAQITYWSEILLFPTTSPSQPLVHWNAIANPSQGNLGYYVAEDTANRKVLIRHIASQTWITLYDFTLNTGDSLLSGTTNSIYGGTFYVDSTKSMFFANAQRKFVYLSTPGINYADFLNHNPLTTFIPSNLVWIEGIGTPLGLNYYQNFGDDPTSYLFLSCKRDSSLLIYINPFLQSCTQVLAFETFSSRKTDFNAFFTSSWQLQIVSEKHVGQSFSVKLYDAIGRIVYNKEDCFLDQDGNLTLTGDFPEGVLHCSIFTQKSFINYKLLRP